MKRLYITDSLSPAFIGVMEDAGFFSIEKLDSTAFSKMKTLSTFLVDVELLLIDLDASIPEQFWTNLAILEKDRSYPFVFLYSEQTGERDLKNASESGYRMLGGNTTKVVVMAVLEAVMRQAGGKDKYATIIDSSPHLICSFLPDFSLTLINTKYEEFFGIQRGDFLGKSFFSLIPESEYGTIKKIIRNLTPKDPAITYEHQVINAAGELRYLEWTDRAYFAKNGKPLRYDSTGRDITELRKALEDSEILSAFIRNSQDIIVLKDTERRIMATNEAFMRAAGYSSVGDLIGKTDAEILGVGEDSELVRSYYQDDNDALALARGEVLLREETILFPDGAEHTFLTRKYPIHGRDDSLLGLGVISTDIAGQKRAQEELLHRVQYEHCFSESVSLLAEDSPLDTRIQKVLKILRNTVGVSRIYIFQNEIAPDGRMASSQRYESCAAGFPPQIDNQDLQHLLYEEGMATLLPFLENRKPFTYIVANLPAPERAILQSQNILSIAIFPIYAGEELWGFVGYDDCKTEREWLEQDIRILSSIADAIGGAILKDDYQRALKASEEEFRLLFENAPLGIYIANVEGNILEVNRALLAILGSPSVEATKKINVLEFPPLVESGYADTYRRCVVENRVIKKELKYTSKWGKKAFLSSYLIPLVVATGKVEKVYTLMEDISERKEAEEALACAVREKQALLRELQHRVKNSFMLVSGMISLMEVSWGSEENRSLLKELNARIAAVVEMYDLLYATGSVSEVQFDHYVQKISTSVIGITHSIRLEMDLQPVLISVKTAIPAGIIIAELITNAVKYAFAGQDDAVIRIGLQTEGKEVVLVIEDNGIGIQNTKGEGKRSSTGLSMMYGLAGQIKGSLEVSGSEGTRCLLRFIAGQ